MGKKKKKTKYVEVVCFCPKRADLESILDEAITKQRWLGEIVDVLSTAYDLEAMLAHLKVEGSEVRWDPSSPPIELIEEDGKSAKFRIDTARSDLTELVSDQPHAWFSGSKQVDDLFERLARCRSVVRIRWPDVQTQPVARAPYWVSRALALSIRHSTGGVVVFGDNHFLAKSGELISPARPRP